MSDTAIGFLIVGIGMLLVLGIVFAISMRPRRSATAVVPPPGVHLPPPSFLPAVLSLAAALIGAGLAFRSDDELANPFLGIGGLVVLVAGVVWWVAAANREWTEVEHGASHGVAHAETQRAHDDSAGH